MRHIEVSHFLVQCGYPIDHPIHHTREHTVDDDRSCYDEHLSPDTEDVPFCLWSSRTH